MTTSTPAASQTDPADKTGAPPRKRKRRWALRVAGVAVVLLVLLVALAPTLLSTGPGNAVVFDVIRSSADVEIERGSLSLGWLGGQSLAADRVADRRGGFEIVDLRLEAPDASLLALARQGDVGELPVSVDSVVIRPASFEPNDAGPEGRAGRRDPPSEPESGGVDEPLTVPRSLAGRVSFSANSIRVETPGEPDVTARGVSAELDIASIRDATLKLSGSVQRGDEPPGELRGDLAVRNAFTADGVAQLLMAEIDGELDLSGLPLSVIDGLAGAGGALQAVLGDRIDAFRVTAKGTAESLDAEVRVAAPALRPATLRVRRGADGLRVSSESPLELRVTPEAFAALAGLDVEASPLLSPTVIGLELPDALLPLDADGSPALERLSVQATATLSPTAVRLDENHAANLAELRLTLGAEALGELAAVSLNGAAELAGVEEPIFLELAARGALSDLPSGTLRTRAPIRLIDALGGLEGMLVDALGDRLDATVDLTPTGDDRLDYRVALSGGKLNGALAGNASRSGDRLTVGVRTDGGLAFDADADATNRLIARLFGDEDGNGGGETAGNAPAATRYLLGEDARFDFTLPDGALAFAAGPDGDPRFLPEASSVALTGHAERLVLINPADRTTITSEGVTLSLDALRPAEFLRVSLVADVPTAPPPTHPELGGDALAADDAEPLPAPRGRLIAEATVREPFDADGRLRLDTQPIVAGLDLQLVLTSILDQLLGGDGNLTALIGEVTTATLAADYTHGETIPLNLEIDSANLKSRAPLVYHPDGWISAADDLTLELIPTKATFEQLLDEALPVLANAIKSTRPVMLKVEGDSVRVPVRPFDLAEARFKGNLDLGELEMTRDGWVSQTVFGIIRGAARRGRLDADGQPRGDTYAAKFTPVDFELRDGIATSSEFWFVADDLAVGFQDSRTDVRNDRIEKMSMGVVGASFIAGSGGALRPFIKPEQIYTLPVSGSLSEPKIETGWLQTEIAGSIASGVLAETTGIGGAIFDIFGNAVRDTKTRPLQLSWSPPEPVDAFIERVVTRDGAREVSQPVLPTPEERRDNRQRALDELEKHFQERRERRGN